MTDHALRLYPPDQGACVCGATFQSYRNRERTRGAVLTDDVLDQYNAHRACVAQQGRR